MKFRGGGKFEYRGFAAKAHAVRHEYVPAEPGGVRSDAVRGVHAADAVFGEYSKIPFLNFFFAFDYRKSSEELSSSHILSRPSSPVLFFLSSNFEALAKISSIEATSLFFLRERSKDCSP